MPNRCGASFARKRSAIVTDVEYFRERVNPVDAHFTSRAGPSLLLSAYTRKRVDRTQKQLMARGVARHFVFVILASR
jgi:hypothetical protein